MTESVEREDSNKVPQRSSQKTVMWLVLMVLLMFGFGYAMVPLYNVFCQITGINGKTGGKVSASAGIVDESRWVTVQFDATNNANLPWKFYPITKKVKLHPGENKQIAYFAENDSGKTMTVQAIPSVTPGDAAKYLKKTECFCFNQQTLKNGESLKMPMIFHIDGDLPKNIKVLTLSYTLFDASGFKARPKIEVGKLK